MGNVAGLGFGLFFILFFFLLVLGPLVLLVMAVVDIARRPDWQWKIARQEKILWLILVILFNILGIPALIYWFSIRPKLIVVEKAAAAGHFGAGHLTYGGWEPSPLPVTGPPPSWHPDPGGQHRWRWWDGRQWTDHVSDGTDASTGAAPTG